jgi:hypothetical protein
LANQGSAEEIRRKIQEDSEARLQALRWRRGLKLEGKGLSTLVRVKIPEGMPMAGIISIVSERFTIRPKAEI